MKYVVTGHVRIDRRIFLRWVNILLNFIYAVYLVSWYMNHMVCAMPNSVCSTSDRVPNSPRSECKWIQCSQARYNMCVTDQYTNWQCYDIQCVHVLSHNPPSHTENEGTIFIYWATSENNILTLILLAAKSGGEEVKVKKMLNKVRN